MFRPPGVFRPPDPELEHHAKRRVRAMTDDAAETAGADPAPLDFEAVEKALGVELAAARRRLGWSQAHAAASLREPLGDRSIIAYEYAQRQVTIRRLLDLAEVYGVSPVWLLAEAILAATRGRSCPTCGRQ